MKILSIETSCDDTGITIFEARGGAKSASFEILADAVLSQKIHAEYGGVYPMMAKREHIKNLPLLTEQMLKKAKLSKSKKPVDAIAVTYGPGLEPCLWTGIVFAKELAEKWNVPIIPVNHMEGHVLSVFAKPKGKFKISLPKSKFPMLSLLVSGGHTELVLIKDLGKYEIIGKTLDDAAGEAYDKVARMLGLEYPGGPKISKLAEEERKRLGRGRKDLRLHIRLLADCYARPAGLRNASQPQVLAPSRPQNAEQQQILSFPRPMLHSKNLDFSFAGLKTAVLYALRKMDKVDKGAVALEFENAVIDTLVHKTAKAGEQHKVKSIIVAGGVAANKHLQRELWKVFGKQKILLPDKKLTGDNALMIGVAGYLEYINHKKKVPSVKNIKATGNLPL